MAPRLRCRLPIAHRPLPDGGAVIALRPAVVAAAPAAELGNAAAHGPLLTTGIASTACRSWRFHNVHHLIDSTYDRAAFFRRKSPVDCLLPWPSSLAHLLRGLRGTAAGRQCSTATLPADCLSALNPGLTPRWHPPSGDKERTQLLVVWFWDLTHRSLAQPQPGGQRLQRPDDNWFPRRPRPPPASASTGAPRPAAPARRDEPGSQLRASGGAGCGGTVAGSTS
jgi:hypothetical protein